VASAGSSFSQLAERYATALFELCDEQKALDVVASDLVSLRSALAESAALRDVLRSPTLSRSVQARAMDAVLAAGGAHMLTRNLVQVAARNGRLFVVPDVVDAFLAELARRRGEMTAKVVSATALSSSQQAALEDALKGVVGAKVAIDVSVDPALIGGMIVKIGSRMIDSSLRTKLNKLQLAMKGVG
jgi:F-type H+-transporting ATPase subunit delta